ncbi:DUF4817 domain-containing protein [Trichonephila clavipes]|nr:DUF4817 domain-containing protein [Trichonephila clavipes]
METVKRTFILFESDCYEVKFIRTTSVLSSTKSSIKAVNSINHGTFSHHVTLIDNSHPQRRRTVRTEEAIATVERSIEEEPNESIRHRAQELDMCPSTLWKILRKDLGLCAYKIQLVQELKPNDHQARRRFVEWAQNEIAVVPDFHKRILFSDEAHFWLNGYVNKQNCRIWSEANP